MPHSKVKEMMLFVAVITSKAHFFAVVICLPILVDVNFTGVKDYELGTLIAVQTAGAIIANKYAEPCISGCGLWVSLNIGFLVLLSAQAGFWTCLLAEKEEIFTSSCFFSLFMVGLGGGILNTTSLITNA